MKPIRMIAMLGAALSLSACASMDVPTRNAPFETLPTTEVAAPDGFEMTRPVEAADTATRAAVSLDGPVVSVAPVAPSLTPGAPVSISSVTVRVPQSLKASEANRFLPRGDIVWRGDPVGDRHEQVRKIFETAMVQGVSSLDGPIKVDLDIEVQHFHSLSEKARYFTGGVHNIDFTWSLKDPETGQILFGPKAVQADLEGFGGKKAIQADAEGQTMKVRITDHLAKVIVEELTTPEGHKNAKLGLIQALDNS